VWCTEFKDGKTAMNDPEEMRGRPTNLHENCVTVKDLIREGRGVKLSKIGEMTATAESFVHELISNLNFHKAPAHWVLKMLTEEHKGRKEWLLCFIISTGDETWVY
jgi:hypothetical protein